MGVILSLQDTELVKIGVTKYVTIDKKMQKRTKINLAKKLNIEYVIPDETNGNDGKKAVLVIRIEGDL